MCLSGHGRTTRTIVEITTLAHFKGEDGDLPKTGQEKQRENHHGMKLTPEELRTMGYDPNQPGDDLVKVVLSAHKADSTHFDASDHTQTPPKPLKRRIRQNMKPLLNELEKECKLWLGEQSHVLWIHDQAVTFRIGNGVTLRPDLVAETKSGKLHAYDVKGNQPIQDDAAVKIKVAAATYPSICWFIAWKEGGSWVQQQILP